MDTIHILQSELNPIETTGHSSKGNQLKWHIDKYWYKADGFGYEGLAETVVSRLLSMSTVQNYVKYEPVQIEWRKHVFDGCRSKHFLEGDSQIITVEKLFRKHTGLSLAEEMGHMAEVTSRIKLLTDFVSGVTGLDDFGEYLATMIEIDAFFWNEDRHTNNICVLYSPSERSYSLCPYFDHGASLFSDITGDYPLYKSVEECEETIEAKPFASSFDEQLDAVYSLFHGSLKFSVKRKQLLAEWNKIRLEDAKNHPDNPKREQIHMRIDEILRMQIRKFDYMTGDSFP